MVAPVAACNGQRYCCLLLMWPLPKTRQSGTFALACFKMFTIVNMFPPRVGSVTTRNGQSFAKHLYPSAVGSTRTSRAATIRAASTTLGATASSGFHAPPIKLPPGISQPQRSPLDSATSALRACPTLACSTLPFFISWP